MTKKTRVEDRLIASARQALAIKRGELAPSNAYDLPLTAREAMAERAPEYGKTDIARIRNSLNLSQALFAEALNVSLGTVRSWEQGIRTPEGAASRLLQVAERDPSALTMYVRTRTTNAAGKNARAPGGDDVNRHTVGRREVGGKFRESSFAHARDVGRASSRRPQSRRK